jgi:hypothetical protein
MEYQPDGTTYGFLTLYFKKKKGIRESRKYAVSMETGYKMVYCKSATDVLSNFNEYIKNKAQVIEVKTLK